MAHLQLTDRERYQIEALKREGFTQSAIARSLGRHPSTINRELARNSDHKGYRGKLAVRRTAKRRQEAKKSIKLDSVMCSMINNLLSDYLSPEQISGRLKLELGVESAMRASTATCGRIRDEGRALEAGLQVEASNHRKLQP